MNFQLQFISDQSNYVFSYLEPPGHVTDLMSQEKWPLVDLEKYLAYGLSNFMNFQHQFIDNQSNKRHFILGTTRTRHRFEVSGEMAICWPGPNLACDLSNFMNFQRQFIGNQSNYDFSYLKPHGYVTGTTRTCQGFDVPGEVAICRPGQNISMWPFKFHEF